MASFDKHYNYSTLKKKKTSKQNKNKKLTKIVLSNNKEDYRSSINKKIMS